MLFRLVRADHEIASIARVTGPGASHIFTGSSAGRVPRHNLSMTATGLVHGGAQSSTPAWRRLIFALNALALFYWVRSSPSATPAALQGRVAGWTPPLRALVVSHESSYKPTEHAGVQWLDQHLRNPHSPNLASSLWPSVMAMVGDLDAEPPKPRLWHGRISDQHVQYKEREDSMCFAGGAGRRHKRPQCSKITRRASRLSSLSSTTSRVLARSVVEAISHLGHAALDRLRVVD